MSPKPHPKGGSSSWLNYKRSIFFLCIATTTIWLYVSRFSGSFGSAEIDFKSAISCDTYSSDCEVTAPFIFDSIFSLLKQWPSSYGANGHAIVPVELPRGMPLYHAKQWVGMPAKPTWFSFDPEMGLGIYASTGITYLHTFVTMKPLRLLYFDGQSAVLSAYGTLDSQTAILRHHIDLEPGNEFIYNETRRGQELCQFARQMKVDGVMRMDAGFEALICDFSSSHMKQAHVANVTVPGNGASHEDDPDLPQDPNRQPPHGIGNLFASEYGWEWLRSSSWHYGGFGGGSRTANQRETRVDLRLCGMVTFYDPRLRSLSGKHHGGTRGDQKFQSGWGLRRGHRLLGISAKDAETVQGWTTRAVKAAFDSSLRPTSWTGQTEQCSGVHWQALSETIVNQHKSRITEIDSLISKYDAKMLSLKDLTNEVHGLSHSILHSYTQYPSKEASTVEEIRSLTVDRCSSIYTDHTPSQMYNDFENLIKQSFHIVLRKLCQYEWEVFEWSEKWTSDLLQRGMDSKEKGGSKSEEPNVPIDEIVWFRNATKGLLEWLGWDIWTECDSKCSWNICYIPQWPLVYAPGQHQGGPYGGSILTEEEQRDFWKPKCISRAMYDQGGGRGRDPDNQLPDVPDEDS